MIKREKENGDAPQVDSRLIGNAFDSSIAFLARQGNLRSLRSRDMQTEIFASHNDTEISVASPFSQENLIILSRFGGGKIENIVLRDATCVRVSREQAPTDELILVKFDPGQSRYPPEDAWKMEEIIRQGVQYSVKGEGTPESITAKLNQLILELG